MQETKFLLFFFFKSSFFILCLNNVFYFLNVNKTPLHIATFDDNFDAVKALCECNEIDLNAQDNEGIFHFLFNFSPIHYAAEKGFFDIVQFLASKENCNTNQVSKYGIPFQYIFSFYANIQCSHLQSF